MVGIPNLLATAHIVPETSQSTNACLFHVSENIHRCSAFENALIAIDEIYIGNHKTGILLCFSVQAIETIDVILF